MRTLIAMLTLVGVVSLSTLEADPPKKFDAARYVRDLKTAKNAGARANAAERLGERGAIRARDVKDAVEPLLQALKDDRDAEVRQAAARALGNIAPNAKVVVPALTAALKDPSVNVKMAAIMALGQYGPEAKAALPSLRELAAMKKNKKLSKTARMAMKSIKGKRK